MVTLRGAVTLFQECGCKKNKMNLNSKYYFDNYGYRVGNTRCRSGKCCNLISVGCIQWDFPSTKLYSKKETLEEILRKIEELLSGSFPIKNIGEGYKIYAGIEDEENAFKTITSTDGVVITETPTTINIGFDTSTLPDTGVTSVGLQAPIGFTVTNSPVTSSGVIGLQYATGYTGYTTAEKTKLAGIEDGAQVNVQSDWNATSGAAQILNKPTLATVATTGDYNDLINLPTLTTGTVTSVALTAPTGLQVTGSPITTSGTLALAFQAGYSIPTNSSQSNWDTAYGWGNHADAGYLTTETDPTVPLHVKGILTTDISNWDTAYAQRIQNLTTTGSSGAATLNSNTLNIPNYTLAGLGGVPLTRSITINGVTQNLSANRTWNIEPDYSALTNDFHVKKTSSGLEDSKIKDTTVGIETSGRSDNYLVVERRTQSTVATTYTIDLSDPSGHYDLTLAGNTSISFSNMIGINQSTVITLVINGNYSLLFPSWLKPMPNNDDYYYSGLASDVNLITILIRNGGGSPQGMYSLTNVDLS